MIDETYRQEILKSAKEARIREITEYQVNIDNFKLAIEQVGDCLDLLEFKEQLLHLLESSEIEQRKAKIMLSAVNNQLKE